MAFMAHLLGDKGGNNMARAGMVDERHRGVSREGSGYPGFILHLRDAHQHRSRWRESQAGTNRLRALGGRYGLPLNLSAQTRSVESDPVRHAG